MSTNDLDLPLVSLRKQLSIRGLVELKSTSSQSQSLFVVLCGSLGQIVVQLALQVVLASKFGSGEQVAAYQAAFSLPTALAAMVAGPLGIAFIPRYQKLRNDDPARAESLLPTLTLIVVVCGFVVSGLLTLFAGPVMRSIVPGFTAEQVARSTPLFQILVWNIPLMVLVGLFQTALNARFNFFIPAVAGVVGPTVTVACMWAGAAHLGIASLAWGVVAGSLSSVLLQGISLWGGMRFPTRGNVTEHIRGIALLAIPAALGMLLIRIDPVVDGYVLASPEPERFANWGWALRIMNMFVLVSSGVLSTVAFPRLSRGAATGVEALRKEVRNALRLFLWVSLPTFAVMTLFGKALIHDLLERGEFLPTDTAAVAYLMLLLAVMVVAAGLGEICGKTFYAQHDTMTPLVLTTIAVGCMIAVKLMFVLPGDVEKLATINSSVFACSACVQLALIGWRLSTDVFAGLWIPLLRCLLATGVTVCWGKLVESSGLPYAGLAGLLSGTAIYFGCLWVGGELKSLSLAE
ncbi:MAG: lipid II flippase MurJ [Planctomycetaceae bacterium]